MIGPKAFFNILLFSHLLSSFAEPSSPDDSALLIFFPYFHRDLNDIRNKAWIQS